jgi:hypothetical protein
LPTPTGIQELAVFEDPSDKTKKLTCYDSTYYMEKNLYAVVCETDKVGDRRGDVLIFLVWRESLPGNIVKGHVVSMVRQAKSGKIAFSEKRLIKTVQFKKGNIFSSETQFLLYDEPFIYQGHQTISKDNLFFLIMSVKGEKKDARFDLQKSETDRSARIVDLGAVRSKIAEIVDLYKVITFEEINGSLLIAGHFDNVSNFVTTLKCQVDTENPEKSFVISACKKFKSKHSTDLGFQSFFVDRNDPKIKRVASYSRRTKKIRVCNLMISGDYKIDDPASYEDGCAEINARSTYVQDIAFGFFDNCDNQEYCDAFWFDEKKTHFIGVDRIKFKKEEISGTGQKYDKFKASSWARYFCYGNSGRMIGEKLFMAEEKFISGFDDKRSEEVLIKANLLPEKKDFYVTLYKSQANTHEFINITGYRVQKMIYQITAKQAFPKFRGSLGQMYHVPLGRDYFNGNALTFKLNAKADIAK